MFLFKHLFIIMLNYESIFLNLSYLLTSFTKDSVLLGCDASQHNQISAIRLLKIKARVPLKHQGSITLSFGNVSQKNRIVSCATLKI
jgi:hypothetical protein